MSTSWLGSILGGVTGAVSLDKLLGDINTQRDSVQNTLYGDDGTGGLMGTMTGQADFVPSTVKSRVGKTIQDENGNITHNMNRPYQDMMKNMGTNAMSMYGKSMSMDPRFSNLYNQAQSRGGQAMNWAGQDRAMGGMMGYGAAQMQGRADSAYGASQKAMMNSMQDTGAREQDIYSRLRAMQEPQETRQMESMNANLFGSGRGGMTSESYGGSPEQHAFAKAQAEARNSASYQAMGQAQQEMMNQGQLAGQYGQVSQGYTQGGQGYNQLAAQFGQNATQNAQMANQFMGTGVGALQAGQQGQGMMANIGQQMYGQQFDPMDQMRQDYQQALLNQQQMGQQGLGLAGLTAQMGIGGLTTDVNYANVLGSTYGKLAEAAGTAASGLGDWLVDKV